MLKIHNLLQEHNNRLFIIFTPLILCIIVLIMPVSTYTLILYFVSVCLEILACGLITWTDLNYLKNGTNI